MVLPLWRMTHNSSLLTEIVRLRKNALRGVAVEWHTMQRNVPAKSVATRVQLFTEVRSNRVPYQGPLSASNFVVLCMSQMMTH